MKRTLSRRHGYNSLLRRVAFVLLSLSLWLATWTTPAAAQPAAESDDSVLEVSGNQLPTVEFYRPVSMPPLPFRKPQIGPVLERAFADDVDRRTTSFIPEEEELDVDFQVPKDEKWIRVDLSKQRVIAYEGEKPVRGFVISSGLPGTPTVTGEFRIRVKVRAQTMSGGDPERGTYYNLPNVEWVQYFFSDYSLHGTYWHNNFGHPMSHGCVNMTNADAKWLFDWAGPVWDGKSVWQRSTPDNPGTLVYVHP